MSFRRPFFFFSLEELSFFVSVLVESLLVSAAFAVSEFAAVPSVVVAVVVELLSWAASFTWSGIGLGGSALSVGFVSPESERGIGWLSGGALPSPAFAGSATILLSSESDLPVTI